MSEFTRIAIGSVAVLALLPVPASAASSGTRLSYQVLAGEKGTVAVDSSRYHNNGVLKGGVTRRYGAYKFHPLSADHRFDRIVAPNTASLNPGTRPFSYGMRIKVQPTAKWEDREMAVLRHGDSETSGGDYKVELKKSLSGVVVVDCVIHDNGQGHGYVRGNAGITINNGHWHTIMCSRAASTITLTVDGHTVTRPTHALGNVEGPVPLLIGCQHQAGTKREQFVGKMDNITITSF